MDDGVLKSQPGDIMHILREATHEAHQRLHRVVNLHRLVSSEECYFDALRRYLSVIDPLEKGLVLHYRQNFGPECDEPAMAWPERFSKAQWLHEDLVHDSRPTEPKSGTAALPVPTHAAFVGRTYVLEGLTLGAVPILKLITRASMLQNTIATRFFSGYRTLTHERWHAYHRWAAVQGVDRQATVDEALTTFDFFSAALQDQ